MVKTKPGAGLFSGIALKAAERRISTRHARTMEASWRLLGRTGDRETTARVHNISRTGIALRTEVELQAGAILAIRLKGIAATVVHPMLARVVRSTASDGTWLVGCRFVKRFSTEDFQELLQGAAPGQGGFIEVTDNHSDSAAAEKRAHERRCGNPVTVRLMRAQSRTVFLEGWVVNRSADGVCLSVPKQVYAGTILRLMVGTTDDWAPAIGIRVKHARLDRHYWFLNCEFQESPTPQLLALLG